MASAAPVEHADSTPDQHFCMPSATKLPAASVGSPRVWWALVWRSCPNSDVILQLAVVHPVACRGRLHGAVGGCAVRCEKESFRHWPVDVLRLRGTVGARPPHRRLLVTYRAAMGAL
eukprot:399751-Prorocentrum_lima.AAC.1